MIMIEKGKLFLYFVCDADTRRHYQMIRGVFHSHTAVCGSTVLTLRMWGHRGKAVRSYLGSSDDTEQRRAGRWPQTLSRLPACPSSWAPLTAFGKSQEHTCSTIVKESQRDSLIQEFLCVATSIPFWCFAIVARTVLCGLCRLEVNGIGRSSCVLFCNFLFYLQYTSVLCLITPLYLFFWTKMSQS